MSSDDDQSGISSSPGDVISRPRGVADSTAGVNAALLARLRIRIPGYQLLKVIGRGGQATVYKAIKLANADAATSAENQVVAIKLLNSGPYADGLARERMRREILAMKALIGASNIVCVFDSGETEDGRDYLVMNYVSGHTLDEFWKHRPAKSAPSDGSSSLLLFKKICDAVGLAHMRGITHRDLSPSNIMVDDRGEPHILDFGLAKTAFDGLFAADSKAVSVTGQFIGKLAYASPEQAKGDSGKIDIRTDVYALGVILYQTVTGGRFPYVVVGNLVDVLNNIIHSQPTPPSKVVDGREAKIAHNRLRIKTKSPARVSETIEAIVLKALEKDPAARYQSAVELARDIDNYLAGQPTLASMSRSGRLGTRPTLGNVTRAHATWALLIGIFLLTSGVGYLKWKSGESTRRAEPGRPGAIRATPMAISAGNGERVIDLIQLADVKRDAIRGPWEKSANGLARLPVALDGLLRTPYQPPAEYDLRVEFTMIGELGGFQFDLTAPCKGTPCLIYTSQSRDRGRCEIGGWVDANSTSTDGGVLFKEGRRDLLVVKVRANNVSAFLNDKLLASTRTDQGPAPAAPCWEWIGKENTIGIRYEHASSILFHRIEVVEVKGAGRIVDLIPLGTMPTLVKAPPSEPPVRIVDLMPFIDPVKDTVKGAWKRSGTELLSLAQPQSRIRINYDPPEEYNLHVVFTRRHGEAPLGQVLSHAGRSFFFNMGDIYNNQCSFRQGDTDGGLGDSPGERAGTPWSPGILKNDQKYSVVFYVRKKMVAVSVDGKLIVDFPTDFSNLAMPPAFDIGPGAMGLIADWCPAIYHTIEIVEITGEGKQLMKAK